MIERVQNAMRCMDELKIQDALLIQELRALDVSLDGRQDMTANAIEPSDREMTEM